MAQESEIEWQLKESLRRVCRICPWYRQYGLDKKNVCMAVHLPDPDRPWRVVRNPRFMMRVSHEPHCSQWSKTP